MVAPACITCGRRGPTGAQRNSTSPAIVLAYTCRECGADVEIGIHSRAQLAWAWTRAAWRQCLKCFEEK